MYKNLKASKTPLQDIEKVSYKGQPLTRRMYRTGYESFFNSARELRDDDRCLMKNINQSKENFWNLAQHLSKEDWVLSNDVPDMDFHRTIVGMESPRVLEGGEIKEGREFVVAKWGKGFSSPIHGHAAGYMHEYLIKGSFLVNTYFMPYEGLAAVRFVEQKLYNKPGDIVSDYFKAGGEKFKRQHFIHNFETLEPSTSLHYVPEHTRDGRDNMFVLETFDEQYEIQDYETYKVAAPHRYPFQLGDVFIVRSSNVPEYGNHYMVITGGMVQKDWGYRPQDKVIPYAGNLLDQYDDNLVMLKLNAAQTILFHKFHHLEF